jgi:hypothetical protein
MALTRPTPMPTIEARQRIIRAATPYAAGETVLRVSLAQEHADMSAWVSGHTEVCDHWTNHLNGAQA